MTSVRFHPEASQELVEAAAYYERHVLGLGDEFIDEVERICALLSKHPSLGSLYDGEHRRALLRRFPYALIYRKMESDLAVIAVAHTKRRPGYWRLRLQSDNRDSND